MAVGLSVSACLDIPSYVCTGDTQCIAENVAGACDFQSGVCVYPNLGCPMQYSDAQGNCMGPANQGGAGGSADGADGGPDGGDLSTGGVDDGIDDGVDDSTPQTTAGDSRTSGDPSTSGPSDTGGTDTDTGLCGGAMVANITDEGLVSASSVFDTDFVALNSVDGDLSTSWFSAGPGAGDPSVFDWTVGQDVCVTTVVFTGNGMHANSSFQTGYGFESMTVVIYDSLDAVVFEEVVDLAGTPDPLQTIMVGGVVGRRVSLELTEHEDSSCGGFSELQVLGVVG